MHRQLAYFGACWYPLNRTMIERIFEILSHTADKGVAGFGHTMAEAFESTAYGMFSLMVDLKEQKYTSEREITVLAADREQLLWEWLAELVFIFDVERILPVEFKVEEIDDTHLRATVYTRPIADDIEWLGAIVKAVTFHQLQVEESEKGWKTRVYVDV